jgi:hypothetical protein
MRLVRAWPAGAETNRERIKIMRKLLLASAALVALTGAAYAQEAPYLAGNYSASVARSHSQDMDETGSRFIIRDFDEPRVFRRSFSRPRVVVRDRFRPRVVVRDGFGPRFVVRDRFAPRFFGPRFVARDPWWGWPGYSRWPRTGTSIGFGGPGWGVGFSSWR